MVTKNNEYAIALEKYQNHRVYIFFERCISLLIMLLQMITLIHVIQTYQAIHPCVVLLVLVMSYFVTDFVNGLAHMYMDNNTNYTDVFGPFVSAFHLHHAHPRYKNQHPVQIYFNASGTKFWLAVYLLLLAYVQYQWRISCGLNIGLVSFGILSSFAEVSHYWAHNATRKNTIIRRLQRYRILLSKPHHAVHHLSDNKNYAFLNGLSDPLLNFISRYCCKGYKDHSDQHTAAYVNHKTT